MRKKNFIFTSESVTEGHPDKIADQISDGILDAIIAQDKNARVACETLVTTGVAFVAGEITTTANLNYPDVVREVIKEIGYDNAEKGFDYKTCAVIVSLDKQSPEIAQGVNRGSIEDLGAGDQGMMFGFACDETPQLMPAPIMFAHALTYGMAKARKEKRIPFLRPDGKSQVTVRYEDGKPVEITNIILAAQHDPGVSRNDIKEALIEEVVKKELPKQFLKNPRYFVNETGSFVLGGPHADCGLTGRKIIVDTYGGYCSHGGGSFSGKDPTKVDRSGTYMMRHIAKNVVAAGLAKRCEVQIAYVIGQADPVAVYVDTHQTGLIPDEKIAKLIQEFFPLRPGKIITYLNLLRPIFKKTAAYGHFGRELPEFTWEDTSRAKELRELAGIKPKGRKKK